MKLRNHWAATAHLWGGRDVWRLWYVAFDGQLDFLRCWLEPILDRSYLSPVPPEWLHMTLGEGDDAETVRERCKGLQPVDALIGPARVFDEGVAGAVHPHDEIDVLYRAIGGGGEFQPHVSFAYASEDAEMDELEVNASDAVFISALSLVDVRRENEVYSWDLVDRVTLGA